jgi:hypothetical protein
VARLLLPLISEQNCLLPFLCIVAYGALKKDGSFKNYGKSEIACLLSFLGMHTYTEVRGSVFTSLLSGLFCNRTNFQLNMYFMNENRIIFFFFMSKGYSGNDMLAAHKLLLPFRSL